MSKSILIPVIVLFGAIVFGMLLYTYIFSLERSLPPATDTVSSIERTPADTVGVVDRSLRVAAAARLPIPGSAPNTDVNHTVTLEEIRQGCFRQDCIPSVDDPVFSSPATVAELLAPDSLGIALNYKDEQRFYPFPMLETRELVNDVVAGDPLLISYCPLCGTGVVFDRVINGVTQEFGVSGMLWNANLLMYNRATDLADRNLWSQVLGEAVVGERAGEKLTIISSDIMTFADWRIRHPEGMVLNTGETADPYGGAYYAVASQFSPNFDAARSILPPDTYVYGIMVAGKPLAITETVVATPDARLVIDEQVITIATSATGGVQFLVNDTPTPDVEGFWFSHHAAHPNTALWSDATITEL